MSFRMLAKITGISIYLYLMQFTKVYGQYITPAPDTVRLTIKEAEKIFLEKNLGLLAQQYQVQADKALIEQARLWDNPVLNTDQNVYANNKWFEHSKNPDGTYNGQVFVQVEQLIKTANKRGKLISMARTNVEISEWQFKDVMRNLKYQLRKDFYTMLQLSDMRLLYKQELIQLDKLLEGMSAQYKMGNIAQKDLLRIQALQISTRQDATDNEKTLGDVEAELKTLLQLNGTSILIPVATENRLPQTTDLNADNLIATARMNNATYQLQQLQLKYQQQNLSYQKALAIPDITLAPSYDHNSNYTPNYTGLGISLPLPVLNRNQGNIRSARWLVKEQEANTQLADVQLQNDVANAYRKWIAMNKLSNNETGEFHTNYGKLYNNIVESYRQRQISLVEFIDYFEAYKDIREKGLQLQLNLLLAKEELNYQAGTDMLP